MLRGGTEMHLYIEVIPKFTLLSLASGGKGSQIKVYHVQWSPRLQMELNLILPFREGSPIRYSAIKYEGNCVNLETSLDQPHSFQRQRK